jgi:hypothetical protein
MGTQLNKGKGHAMNRIVTVVVVAALATQIWAAEETKAPGGAGERPTVEIAFVLDTTGSMGGLIAGAKAKIWQIANQMVSGEPRPKVKIALVPYRDKGDEYVTKVFELTDNIDKVYEDLQGFEAVGGGDGPENVNQALSDAINKLSWSEGRKTLKIIFLVGDYPPHNEYEDVPTYDKLAKAAITKGIYINTILCGNNDEARKVWTEIARAAEGDFMAIQQDGGVVAVATPYDDELGGLTTQLNATIVRYGAKADQDKLARYAEVADAKSAPAAIKADRVSFAAKSGVSVGGGDLVDAVKNEKLSLKDVKEEDLPENMQKMSAKEREAYLKQQMGEREKVNARILELSKMRDAYIAKELAKKPDAIAGFDYQVIETLQKQAAKHDIHYKAPTTQPTKTDGAVKEEKLVAPAQEKD